MSEADVPNGLRTERVTLEDVIAEPFVDSRGASETDRLRADADYLLRLFHGQANDFAEVLSVVGRISARVGRLERMLANSGSASSAAAAEQEAPAASGAADSEIRDGVLALEHMLYVFRDDQRPTVQTRLEKLRRLVELLRDQAPAANVVPSAIAMMIDIITSDSVCVDQDEKHAAMATLVEAVCPGYVLAPAANGAAGTETDAWGVRRNGLVDCVAHRSFRKSAEGSAEQWGGIVVALYAAPQPAPGWLTAEEREALKLAADAAYDKQEDTLRSRPLDAAGGGAAERLRRRELRLICGRME